LQGHASVIGYLKGVWFDHLSDAEIEDLICKKFSKLQLSAINPAEWSAISATSIARTRPILRTSSRGYERGKVRCSRFTIDLPIINPVFRPSCAEMLETAAILYAAN
jgi:hypothetical protein